MSNERLHWLVGYTMPRCEKKLHSRLADMGVESYLPLNQVIKEWSDRKKKIEVPLFPNYVFIHVNPRERWNLLQCRELVRFVAYEGRPAIMHDEEIHLIRTVLVNNITISSEAGRIPIRTGKRVVVKQGSMAGMKGIMVRENHQQNVIIHLDALNHTIVLHLEAGSVLEDFEIQTTAGSV
ncbi:MAG: hypothetical protein AVDCRST_MAG56-2169 [uncultured Cytophagales bacterium]|uniref:NusG-like N-terminal domain-containing protein n=1 Tax=uncultured Cytophagales bacterium TaxID=158755 RepID=A0A6J4IHP4_9SPHI|nr:MAG: hypothetical protein AVDCRST_MAG56-2169 [uncultured Cytophagales bacterium]